MKLTQTYFSSSYSEEFPNFFSFLGFIIKHDQTFTNWFKHAVHCCSLYVLKFSLLLAQIKIKMLQNAI